MTRSGPRQDIPQQFRSRYVCGRGRLASGAWLSGDGWKQVAPTANMDDGHDVQQHPPYTETNHQQNHSGDAETIAFPDSKCPASFDGLICWPTTQPGEWSHMLCPSFTHGAKENKTVSRYCRKDGLWESSDATNYANCGLDKEKSMALRHLYRRNWIRGASDVAAMEEEKRDAASLEMDRTHWNSGGNMDNIGKVIHYSGRSSDYGMSSDEVEGKVVHESHEATDHEKENSSAWFLIKRLAECMEMKSQTATPADGNSYCPTYFDGWTCWNQTKAGETAFMPCPYFLVGFDPNRYAFRKCLTNGSWFVHPETGTSWSNYTTCVDMDDLKFRLLVNNLYTIGYSISLVALVISLLIFLSFKSLKCTRITIHIHLFLAFAGTCLTWIIWYKDVVCDPTAVAENGYYCQALHILLRYMTLSNYMWMFCEGLHLHLALVVVFVNDEIVLRWFYFVGWILPILLTAAYAVSRGMDKKANSGCWLDESVYEWILIAPVIITLTASLIFLINVVRILLTKLHSRSANPAPIGMKKAVRATLILIPLFGIQHVLIPFRPEANAPGEAFYQIFAAGIVSLQGLCVACLFCFANVDVHQALRSMVKKIISAIGHNSDSSGAAGAALGYSAGAGNGTTAAFAIGDRGGSFRATEAGGNSVNNQTNQTCPDTCV
ncbi:calcitonin gene-related peptide type 1 receptor-like [Ischnura elegans]|uniref:calcitonin gene-related peptide type 1 receptor-like n=1 Tax=Ischnura elegans TaxID=197161 RepID=UPI001ED89601|nr:calcitonin gene-related peptide type 1 receptor-like [Ischnura elegans]